MSGVFFSNRFTRRRNKESIVSSSPVERSKILFMFSVLAVEASTKQNQETPNSPPNMETDSASRELTQWSAAVANVQSPASTASVLQTCTSSNTTAGSATTNDPNWQASKLTIRERNAAMFNNELMADVHFVVGNPGNRIRTHERRLNEVPERRRRR